ncbi:hypothetical protein Tsubulata_015902 [Turnera subulata]|uniref:RING-type E3 ubiquitin transferase n=1 Tax=Turnera subulata TaxID=218843 RepID=A0A9Q0J2M9_9ROSI|nr:hypothetical protein Tsubulata_015902 [Turnera subulata]
MEEVQKPKADLTSAAAFVEGGIQDSCDDACSICLEEFSASDPSATTSCKHEFHLQCILEWCQRSSQCPMCMQPIALKDPTSQELFEAVERERKLRATPPRNATIFRHPTLGDFELQHLPVGATDDELEERIIQHLAAAAAMGRTRHYGRREGQRNRSSSHGRPHFLVFSSHPSVPTSSHVHPSMTQLGEGNEPVSVSVASPSTPLISSGDEPSQSTLQFPDQSSSAPGSSVMQTNRRGYSFNHRSTTTQSSQPNQDRAGPSDFQTFSENLKSRLNAVSMRYKESISRSTRGWKERLFSRSTSDIGSEVQRNINAGIASVSRMMEQLEARDNSSTNRVSADSTITERSNQNNAVIRSESGRNEGGTPASCAASSASS